MKIRILFPVILTILIAAITLPVTFTLLDNPKISTFTAFCSIAIAVGLSVSPLGLILEIRRWFGNVETR